jgi:hypothetical protein
MIYANNKLQYALQLRFDDVILVTSFYKMLMALNKVTNNSWMLSLISAEHPLHVRVPYFSSVEPVGIKNLNYLAPYYFIEHQETEGFVLQRRCCNEPMS